MGWARVAGLLLLTAVISLTNANTTPVISTTFVELREDIPEGTYAFTINATDRDPKDKLAYALSGINSRFFTVNPSSGEVSIRSSMDREAVKELNVILLDANDNYPIFRNAPYNVDVAENTTMDTILFTVSATDDDIGLAGSVKYKIDEVIPRQGRPLFTLDYHTGQFKLNQSLNYNSLSTFYRIKINASDEGGPSWGGPVTLSSVTYALITVDDVADLDPRFLLLPYIASVEEGSPVGTTVLTVTALDPDTGVHDVIIYSIESAGSIHPNLFHISETTGAISVKSVIDRETVGGSVILTVKATETQLNIHGEKAVATADVQISIIDVNDNTPLFYSCGPSECIAASQFRAEISEDLAGTLQINMTVEDPDQDAQIQLKVAGVDMGAFRVIPSIAASRSEVQLMILDPQLIDFERKEEMVVQVIAIDLKNDTMRSTATVTIKILDINDNSPTFPSGTYTLKVAEHSANGTQVANITANDLDMMDQDQLTYRLLPESIGEYFGVMLHEGIVFVANSRLIDREVTSLYSATLQAKDTHNNTGTTILKIRLTDINDQPPVFNKESYTVSVQEGKQLELQIGATDADEPETENSKIVFAIVPSPYSMNLTIDPNTGLLKNSHGLDREAIDPEMQGRIELTVTATDQGEPALMSLVRVIIHVEDTNDNQPIFSRASYNFSVKEGAKGAFVGSVQAVDLDQDINFNRISFSILNGSFGNFIIRTFKYDAGYGANITVDPDIVLDYEQLPNRFTLWVEAEDLSQSKAGAAVNIEVLDVNDERPVFQPSGPMHVQENSTVTGVSGQFLALDKDGNHSLVYHLESCECRCNGTLKSCNWMLMDNEGAVTVNPEATLDYEECDQVLVTAQVVDEFTEKGENDSSSSAVMVVNIVDINDNAPEFLHSDAVFVLVSETASMGTSVAGVTATDHDTGINKVIQFQVTEVKFQDTNSQISPTRTIFEAVTTQQRGLYVGIIQSIEELNSNQKGKYLVTVTATDGGGLSTTSELEIFIVDKSFKIQLRFESPLAEVTKNQRSITLAPGDTLMDLYFVYHNGTAIPSDAVERMLSEPEYYLTLRQYGLTYIVNPPDTVRYVLLGLVGGLIIVLTVLTTSLVCTRRSYRTKLKAAKAMKSTKMEATDNHGGPVVPGTNKYTMEGANPVLNLKIDTDLGFDEENSTVDRDSVNSFDDGMSLHSEMDRTMMVIQEEDEESIHIEPLGAALAQRANKQNTVVL
ncbi:hypothetical protein NHX12_034266 [Muraenolepis orangiensis]|uniref:Cadherin domain-containing protein n=1 Tax=Muraenolepis orangiensis TaxID=630683 RepID=A0A9Q0D2Y0_9TELE|nr:hypothetical protein NHX12_034266 [Muraenolepis orangiensis]